MPSLWPVLSATGSHKDTEASAGSVAVHGYPGCDLHRRHVITPPTEQGATENLCSSGRPTGKAGLCGEKGEVLPHVQWHINVLELRAAISSESTSAVPRVSRSSTQTHSLKNRQHNSGGVHQQERGRACAPLL